MPHFRNVVAVTAVLASASAPLGAQVPFGGYPAARAGGNYMHNYYFPPAPSSTPWYPTWSPEGDHVAVAMSGSIWSVNLESGRAVELVSGPKYYSSPDYSPDGRWLVYTADDHGRSIQLEVLDLTTGQTHELTNDSHIYVDPRFSPDGTRIAYVSTQPNGYFNVYVRPFADGAWRGAIQAVTRDNSYGADRLYFGPNDIHISPAWFPGGSDLLLVSNRDVPLGSGNVFRVPAREGGFQQRQIVLVEQTLYRTQPDVSIDGRRFVYSSTAGTADQFNNLYVQPTDGGQPYKLTHFEHDAFHPRWSPDGERIAYIDNRSGLPELKVLETYGGRIVDVDITSRSWQNPTGRLRVTTTARPSGESTGEPTASRIHLTAADGKFYAPHDAYARIGPRGQFWAFHQTGSFEVELPVGEASLLAVKGLEHEPAASTVEIREGQVSDVVLELEEVVDMAAGGWFNGSTHLHANYGGNLHNSLQNLMMMSEAEDQDIVLEQIANKDNRILDYQFFEPGGGAHSVSTPEQLVVVGQEYRPPFYGHVFMFGMTEHLISPFTTGYEGTGIESLYPSNTDMFRKAREQGAYTGYVHSGFNGDPLQGNLGGAKGFMVDAALGTIDAVEWGTSQDGFAPVYAAWNNGLPAYIVGGEDAISDLQKSNLVGSVRTYVNIPSGELTMRNWFDGMRDGRSFMTNGPLVELQVDGRIPGETLEIPAGADVSVTLEVTSLTPLERAEIVFNGEVILSVPFTDERRAMSLQREFRPERSGWYHIRVTGARGEGFPMDAPYVQAATNPVWVVVDGAPVRSVEAADYGIAWIDRLEALAEEWPGWRSDAEKSRVYAQFEEARDVYRRFRSEAGGP